MPKILGSWGGMRRYLEQSYNAVNCTYSASTGRVTLRLYSSIFSAALLPCLLQQGQNFFFRRCHSHSPFSQYRCIIVTKKCPIVNYAKSNG